HGLKAKWHRPDVRNTPEAVLAKPIAEIAGHAVEQRIAAGDDDHALLAEIAFEGLDGLLKIRTDAGALGLQLRQEAKRLIGAEDEIGSREQFSRARGDASQSVATDADDVDFRFRHEMPSSHRP